MMVAVSPSETFVNIYQSTWRDIPEDSHLKIPIFLLTCPTTSLQHAKWWDVMQDCEYSACGRSVLSDDFWLVKLKAML
jgi:hypothetical protein